MKKRKLIVAVLPGFWLTLARLFRLRSLFISDDLPTFDLPAKARSGKLVFGYWLGFTAEIVRSTL